LDHEARRLACLAPAPVAEAIGLLTELGTEPKVLAGGQSLLLVLNM
jgi:CO/xanthine dehydrogenase FAD-binding subunit